MHMRRYAVIMYLRQARKTEASKPDLAAREPKMILTLQTVRLKNAGCPALCAGQIAAYPSRCHHLPGTPRFNAVFQGRTGSAGLLGRFQ